MSGDRLLLDTSFLQALLNRKDQHHDAAKSLLPRVTAANEVWVTEAVLIELANALSALNREGAAKFIEQCYRTANVHVVNVGTPLLESALDFYRARSDKEWSLTDCISMIVMREQNLVEVVTTDHHFVQAGYRASLLP